MWRKSHGKESNMAEETVKAKRPRKYAGAENVNRFVENLGELVKLAQNLTDKADKVTAARFKVINQRASKLYKGLEAAVVAVGPHVRSASPEKLAAREAKEMEKVNAIRAKLGKPPISS